MSLHYFLVCDGSTGIPEYHLNAGTVVERNSGWMRLLVQEGRLKGVHWSVMGTRDIPTPQEAYELELARLNSMQYLPLDRLKDLEDWYLEVLIKSPDRPSDDHHLEIPE